MSLPPYSEFTSADHASTTLFAIDTLQTRLFDPMITVLESLEDTADAASHAATAASAASAAAGTAARTAITAVGAMRVIARASVALGVVAAAIDIFMLTQPSDTDQILAELAKLEGKIDRLGTKLSEQIQGLQNEVVKQIYLNGLGDARAVIGHAVEVVRSYEMNYAQLNSGVMTAASRIDGAWLVTPSGNVQQIAPNTTTAPGAMDGLDNVRVAKGIRIKPTFFTSGQITKEDLLFENGENTLYVQARPGNPAGFLAILTSYYSDTSPSAGTGSFVVKSYVTGINPPASSSGAATSDWMLYEANGADTITTIRALPDSAWKLPTDYGVFGPTNPNNYAQYNTDGVDAAFEPHWIWASTAYASHVWFRVKINYSSNAHADAEAYFRQITRANTADYDTDRLATEIFRLIQTATNCDNSQSTSLFDQVAIQSFYSPFTIALTQAHFVDLISKGMKALTFIRVTKIQQECLARANKTHFSELSAAQLADLQTRSNYEAFAVMDMFNNRNPKLNRISAISQKTETLLAQIANPAFFRNCVRQAIQYVGSQLGEDATASDIAGALQAIYPNLTWYCVTYESSATVRAYGSPGLQNFSIDDFQPGRNLYLGYKAPPEGLAVNVKLNATAARNQVALVQNDQDPSWNVASANAQGWTAPYFIFACDLDAGAGKIQTNFEPATSNSADSIANIYQYNYRAYQRGWLRRGFVYLFG